jgi:hypothetical protein
MSTAPIIRPSRETIGERRFVHGYTVGGNSPTYRCWSAMLTRCTNPNFPGFQRYGAQGITVCERWRSFDAFLEDMGERPSPGHSIDRIDGARGYEPGNCRWADHREQCRNRKTTRAVIRSDGVRYRSIVEAAEAVGGNRHCIRDVCTGRQKTHLGYTWRYAE